MSQDVVSREEDTLFEFPCDFPIKCFGSVEENCEEIVIDIIRGHFPEITEQHIRTQLSSKGNFVSVTVTVFAQSKAQLDKVYMDLTACKVVKMAI